MERRCTEDGCDAPLTPCNAGFTPLGACPHWARARKGEPRDDDVEATNSHLVPWPWGALGRRDIDALAARSAPHLIGLVGLPKAGKTTLLSMAYLHLSSGGSLAPDRFAGSLTLGGWEQLAQPLRWEPASPPRFPQRTPRGTGRVPGMLHLALRSPAGSLRDVLITDAPGEWFARWSTDRAAPAAEGARWIVSAADAFILVIDSEALSGPDRHDARTQHAALIRRLAAEATGRPVVIAWAKADLEIPAAIRTGLESLLAALFPGMPVHNVSVYETEMRTEYLPLLTRVLSEPRPRAGAATEPVIAPDDPFLAFRGR